MGCCEGVSSDVEVEGESSETWLILKDPVKESPPSSCPCLTGVCLCEAFRACSLVSLAWSIVVMEQRLRYSSEASVLISYCLNVIMVMITQMTRGLLGDS